MLSYLLLTDAFILAVLYPLCFLISAHDPLKSGFHRFHLGMPCVVGGIVTAVMALSPFPLQIKSWIGLWELCLFITCFYYWKKESVNPFTPALSSAIGIIAYFKLEPWVMMNRADAVFISVLAGLILCASLFAMNLGHWYLNVHGLPISHLQRATYAFWALVALRALWDGYQLATARLFYDGEVIPLWQYVCSSDGFLLIMAILFGTIFPLITLYFVRGTLIAKSTQSATGILYAILCAVLTGDLIYKYYLIKLGIAL